MNLRHVEGLNYLFVRVYRLFFFQCLCGHNKANKIEVWTFFYYYNIVIQLKSVQCNSSRTKQPHHILRLKTLVIIFCVCVIFVCLFELND